MIKCIYILMFGVVIYFCISRCVRLDREVCVDRHTKRCWREAKRFELKVLQMLNNCNYFHTSPPNDNFTLFLPFVNGVRETGRRRKLVHFWPFLMLSRKLFYFHVDWLMLMPMPVVNHIRVLNTFFQIFGIYSIVRSSEGCLVECLLTPEWFISGKALQFIQRDLWGLTICEWRAGINWRG